MARRGPRRGAAIGVPRRARFGARPPRPARSPVSAGWVAGDRDPGDRGGDGLLRRVRDLGGYRADRGARPTGDPVSATDREDVPSGISTTESGGLDRRLGAYFTALAATEAAAEGRLLAVALDGKTLRGARRAGAAAAHLVSVFAHRARLVLGQLAVAEKSNEIPCVRKILHPFRQVRLLVTVDAMHTQTATAKLICHTLKSHYLMIVKSNQPKLLARITALPWTRVPVTATDDAHGHGRVERRTLKVLTATRGIGFPYAKQIIQITRERVTAATGERTREVVYESAASHSNTPGRR